ncbi:MAG: PH domain-containing protein [Thermoanaerobaculia bacterium]
MRHRESAEGPPAAPVAEEGAEGAGVLELAPKKSTFILSRLVPALVTLALLAVAAGWALGAWRPAAALLVPPAFLALSSLATLAAFVAYRKERYHLHPTRIVATRGTLLSDEHTELDVRHITHVKLRLPWLRHKLFRVGDLFVESAGIGTSAVVMRTIREPEAAAAHLEALMRRNGFSLRRDALLHEERPATVGVVLECAGIAVGAAFTVSFVGPPLLGLREVVAETGAPGFALLALLTLVAVGAVAALVLHFLDLSRRSYRVHDDCIVYEEGFLTRNNAFIPAENLADSHTRRSFLDRLLGLYDVEVSCQGSGQEVRFRHLRRGVELAAAIDRVVEAHRALSSRRAGRGADMGAGREAGRGRQPEGVVVGPAPEGVPAEEVRVAAGEPAPDPAAAAEPAWTAELSMHPGRAAAQPLLFCLVLPPLIPLWLVFLVGALVRAACTKYQVRSGSVRSSFRLVTSSDREFSYDKLTGVVVRESPFDRWLGTVTVRLWSIGAPQPLDLLHVRRAELDLPALLRQAGIPAEEPVHETRPRFSVAAACRANLATCAALGAVIPGGIAAALLTERWLLSVPGVLVAALAAGLLYRGAFHRRARLVFHRHHLELGEGILVRRTYRARYDHVKKTVLTQYPFSGLGSDLGRVQLLVAGEERRATAGQGGRREVVRPYGFALHYVEGLETLAVVLDGILEEGPGAELVAALEGGEVPALPAPVRESRPDLANSLVPLLGLSVLLFPLLALLPVTVPWLWLVVRRRRYRVEPHRVVARWGVLYRCQASILHGRIDTLRRAQGALSKLFGNGTVTLFTAGSSRPDLALRNLPDHPAVYEAIQGRTE